MTNRVLLITDDKKIIKKVQEACKKIEVDLDHVNTIKESEKILTNQIPPLILCDYITFEKLRKKWPAINVLLYTEPTESEQVIEAIKHGAIDYLVRPIKSDILAKHIKDAIRISRDIRIPTVYDQPEEEVHVDRIIGQSPIMKEVYKLIGLIAPRDINVLITGESGTGKELVARAILHHSPRKNKPYLAVNCAAIPETLLESELFGHEKGSFTGADHRRIGKFEQTNGGTLFLDEIGDIPLKTQAKLLRVLQDNTFQRIGGTETIKCNVRIISATHQSLEQLIKKREFRQDLYYRLKVASINVPPLREREVDVVLLAHHFVEQFNKDFDTNIRVFSPEVLPVLLKYSWPGNVRELENAIKSALVVARGSVMRMEFLPEHIREGAEITAEVDKTEIPSGSVKNNLETFAKNLVSKTSLSGNLYKTALEMIEKEIIRACLERTNCTLSQAAKILGISRTTLRKKMSELGIQVKVSFDK